MRRWFAILILIALIVVPAAAFAQDGQPLWDLSETFTVTDLGFQFNYPDGWLFAADNGIVLAETQADLDAQTDDDDTTRAEGFVITLRALPLEALNMEAGTPLEDIVATVIELAEIKEQDRVELPVMTRRSISIFGVNTFDKPGIGSIWTQDDILVIFNIGAKEASRDLAYSWGQILGSLRSVDALNLGKDTLEGQTSGLTMQYPEGWTLGRGPGPDTAAEIEADLTSDEIPTGILVGIFDTPLSSAQNDEIKTVDDVVALLKEAQGWDPDVILSEHIILGQPALLYFGPTSGGATWSIFTVAIIDDSVVLISALGPSEEQVAAFKPTYLAILQSISAPE